MMLTDRTVQAIEVARTLVAHPTPVISLTRPFAEALVEIADELREKDRRSVESLHELHAAHEKRQITIATILDAWVKRLREQPSSENIDELAKIAREIRLHAEDQLGTPRLD
jgi:hypothetical protein